MKRIVFFVTVAIIACGMYSCKSVAYDYRTNADWPGIYSGTVPCADCSGISVEITLNSDLTYSMKRTYIDKQSIATVSGSFTWNSTGTAIDLQGVNEGGGFEHFLVQDNKLILLSTTGEVIKSISGLNYTLTKVNATRSATVATTGITDRYWKLVELMGEPVTYPEKTSGEAYISLKPDGTVGGNLGCNTFSGNYTLQEGSRIRFSNLVNTLKMCVDMNIENKMKEVLEMTDNYNVTGDQLLLNRARMAPLARFEAVYMK